MKKVAIDLSCGEVIKGADVQKNHLSNLKNRRKRWLSVHLWLGLLLGFFLAVFGVTGSILVFYQEIDNVINSELRVVQVPKQGEATYHAFAEIQAAAVSAMPPQAILDFVDYPSYAESAYKFGFNVATTALGEKDQWHVHVNPYTARVLGRNLIKKADDVFPVAFIPFIFQLHFTLLAGEIGGIIVGIMGVILSFSVFTGLIVWWPLTGNWRRAMSIKPRTSTERFNHDLHQTSGFYTFPILFAVLLSGVYMNLPDQFMALVDQLSPGTDGFMNNPDSLPAAGKVPIGLGQALTIVQSHYPEGRVDWLSPALGDTGSYLIGINDVPNLSLFLSARQVAVDQYSGKILVVRDPTTRNTAGQTFIDWQWPLHSGRAFGWTGRILVFLSGLACPVLFVTGMIRWLQKRRAKVRRHIKQEKQKFTSKACDITR